VTSGTLSRTEIERLFDELAERLHEKRTFAKLHLVGGACLALAYERDRTTEAQRGKCWAKASRSTPSFYGNAHIGAGLTKPPTSS